MASAAGGLGATASARERAPTLGSLQKIVQGAQDVREAQRTATGHRLSEISDSNATWMIEHDPLGRVTAALDKEYEYDPLGKLVLARDTNGDLLESYLMTADGRIAQIQRHDAQGYTASMFAYDGSQMTASFTEGTGGTWTQDWQAVWGPGQDQLLEFHDFHTGKTFAVAQDHRNNVVALLDDATGTLDRVMHYTPEGLSTHYSESGQVLCDEEASLVVTCTELNMPFGFNGMWRSNTTGLSHMRNRWYSPQLGQFMSHDPLEYIDSYDLYAFAKLDPTNFWDPWGLSGGQTVPDSDDTNSSRNEPSPRSRGGKRTRNRGSEVYRGQHLLGVGPNGRATTQNPSTGAYHGSGFGLSDVHARKYTEANDDVRKRVIDIVRRKLEITPEDVENVRAIEDAHRKILPKSSWSERATDEEMDEVRDILNEEIKRQSRIWVHDLSDDELLDIANTPSDIPLGLIKTIQHQTWVKLKTQRNLGDNRLTLAAAEHYAFARISMFPINLLIAGAVMPYDLTKLTGGFRSGGGAVSKPRYWIQAWSYYGTVSH